MGQTVANTPIWAFEKPAERLMFFDQMPADADADASPNVHMLAARREDISIQNQLVFVIHNVITAAEADAIVEASEYFGYRSEAPGIATPPGMRMNKAVHFMADSGTLDPIWRRISHLLPTQLAGKPLYDGFSERINMYRYDDDDVFSMHTDGQWPGYGMTRAPAPDLRPLGMHEQPGIASGLSMLLYLNGPADGLQGGHTRLFSRDRREHVDMVPVKGSALFFRNGFTPDSVFHEGCAVRGDVSKYVARMNIMYHL